MSVLFDDLAPVYEAMYQTFINYQEEFEFYSAILEKYEKSKLLEIGSGAGHLAEFFCKAGITYHGLDLSEAMIALAKKRIPEGSFLHADMCSFKLRQPIDSIISAGRTVSYLLQNRQVNAAFANFYDTLMPGGIICFDFIDANTFIPAIQNGKEVILKADHEEMTYVRESFWKPNLQYGMDVIWEAAYYKVEKERTKIGEDRSILRTFTLNEIEIFLSINGFKLIESIQKPSYAFPTFVVVAEKIT